MRYISNEIIRPHLTAEDKKKRVINVKTTPVKLVRKKASLGDHYLRRPSFITQNVKPRDVVDFAKLLSQLEQREGVKIRLGPGTVQKLTNIQIDDPEDTAWLNEYNRRKAAGETDDQLKSNPPLGRLQKKKYVNVAENQKLEIKDELEKLRQQVMSGLNALEKKQSLVTLADVAGKPLDPADLNQMKLILDTLKLSTTPKDWGLPNEIDYDTYKLNPGLINLFLINKAIREGRDINKPIIFQNIAGVQDAKPLMSIPNLMAGKGYKGKFILKDAMIIAERKTGVALLAETAEEKYKDQIKEEEKRIIITNNKIQKLNVKISNIENKINSNEAEIIDLKKDDTKLNNDKSELVKLIRIISSDKSISHNRRKKQIKQLQNDINKIDKQLNSIPGKIKTWDNKIAKLRNELLVLEQRKTASEDIINDSNTKIADYKQEIINLKKQKGVI